MIASHTAGPFAHLQSAYSLHLSFRLLLTLNGTRVKASLCGRVRIAFSLRRRWVARVKLIKSENTQKNNDKNSQRYIPSVRGAFARLPH